MAEVIPWGVSVVLLIGLIGRWYVETRAHNRRLSALGLRVHVNGIRGKSTVTRIVAGAPDRLWVTDITEHPTREARSTAPPCWTSTHGGSWVGL